MKSFTTRPLVIAFLLTISSAASGQIYVGGSIGGSYAKAESSNSNFRFVHKMLWFVYNHTRNRCVLIMDPGSTRNCGIDVSTLSLTQVFQLISLRRCTSIYQIMPFAFATQVFCLFLLRCCTKFLNIILFVRWRRLLCGFPCVAASSVDLCDVFGWKYDTVVCKFNVKQCI